MNGGGGGFGGGSGSGGRRKMAAPPPARSKDRDEDLLLFRDMYKRDKDRVVSLLQPVSDEFEANGNYPLYGMASGNKKGNGFGFLGENEKNDYDWLKTPPATPLFPSLEMDSKKAPELVVQREIPILQPLSRFAANSEEAAKETSNNAAGRPKSPNPRPKFPRRSITPSGRPSISVSDHKKNIIKSAPIVMNPKLNQLNSSTGDLNVMVKKSNSAASVASAKPTSQKESHLNSLAANLSKSSMQSTNSLTKTNPKSRGVSPLVRSTIPAQIATFSDETPSNLKTDRSASRGRSTNQKPSQSTSTTSAPQKPEQSNVKGRRQSCSPSVARGRKVAPVQETASEENNNSNNVSTPRGKMYQTGNGGQVFGSKMVDKLMHARKTSVEEREAKPKLNSSLNEGSGFGRMMSKSSLDMAVKHMEVKRDSVHSRQPGVAAGKKSISISNHMTSKSSGGSYRVVK